MRLSTVFFTAALEASCYVCCCLMNCCLCQQDSGNDSSYQEKNLVMSLRDPFSFKRGAGKKSRIERL